MPKPFALAADLDGTLIGDPDSLRELLSRLAAWRRPVLFLYLTGRYYGSALAAIAAAGLPYPTVLVTDVGGAIHWHGTASADPRWAETVLRDWHPRRIEDLAGRIAGLDPQPLPTRWRRSYRVAEGHHEPVHALRKALREARLRNRVVFSSGHYVDILPRVAGKGAALRHVVRRLGLGPRDILVAGDSGNDLDMLLAGYPAVVVGNAQPELADRRIPGVYRARRPYAGGIIEALSHFHPSEGR